VGVTNICFPHLWHSDTDAHDCTRETPRQCSVMIVVIDARGANLIRIPGRKTSEVPTQRLDGGRVVVMVDSHYEIWTRSVQVLLVVKVYLAEYPEAVDSRIHRLDHDITTVWYD